MNDLVWDDLRVLLAVHRRGSHAAAGRELGVDATTIGRRISVLETRLGARLFDRAPRGLTPTKNGEALARSATRMEEALLAGEREVRGADTRISGSVRVTAGDGLVHFVLAPAVTSLVRLHPDLTVELRADTRALDLSRREADVAVRLSRPREGALVARRLGVMRFGIYGSRAYFERRAMPRRSADLPTHDFVGFEPELDDLPQSRWLRKLAGEPRWVLRANTTSAHAAACRAGLGLALLPVFVGARMTDLVPVLPRLEGPSREAYLVVHEQVRKSARVDAVLTWIAHTWAEEASRH